MKDLKWALKFMKSMTKENFNKIKEEKNIMFKNYNLNYEDDYFYVFINKNNDISEENEIKMNSYLDKQNINYKNNSDNLDNIPDYSFAA